MQLQLSNSRKKMSIVNNIRDYLDKIGLTDSSKTYTPFTLLSIFFAIYFNAEILGKIFLSGDWSIIQEGLSDISKRNLSAWVNFTSKVFFYAVVVTFLLGLFQTTSAFFRTITSVINIQISRIFDKINFVRKTEILEVDKKLREAISREKILEDKIISYHEWTPERIKSLSDENKSLKLKLTNLQKSENNNHINYQNPQNANNTLAQELTDSNNRTEELKSKYLKLIENLKIQSSKAEFLKWQGSADHLIIRKNINRTDPLKSLIEILDKFNLRNDFVAELMNKNREQEFITYPSAKHGFFYRILEHLGIGTLSKNITQDKSQIRIEFSPVENHRLRTALDLNKPY